MKLACPLPSLTICLVVAVATFLPSIASAQDRELLVGWAPSGAIGGGISGYPDNGAGAGAVVGLFSVSGGARYGLEDVHVSFEAGWLYEGGDLPSAHYGMALIGIDFMTRFFRIGLDSALLIGSAADSFSAGARITSRVDVFWGVLSVDLGYELREQGPLLLHGITSLIEIDVGLAAYLIVRSGELHPVVYE